MAAAGQVRRSSGLLAGLLVLVAVASFVHFSPLRSPAFILGSQSPVAEAQTALRGVATAATPAAIFAAPLAASAATAMPTPVLGIGMLSVIVVIVLLISSVAIGRGLVETIDDL
eukprot:CAMPEP_0170593904 /NCGR_PEP_ID=MMETSP0224-20130122/13710_1 /TAXON_ID=285029 /ORGANISM="Togula jolla, Strain CCCM 725" /LENGTH=113 /DNA_ID=CAMNT_0010917915 /DNA_START=36 /DNA_END=377 /DNA_ORIENTATION=+